MKFKYVYSCYLIRISTINGLLSQASCRVGDLFATKEAAKKAGYNSFGFKSRHFTRVEVDKQRVSVSRYHEILTGVQR
jgi:hypothetical protein